MAKLLFFASLHLIICGRLVRRRDSIEFFLESQTKLGRQSFVRRYIISDILFFSLAIVVLLPVKRRSYGSIFGPRIGHVYKEVYLSETLSQENIKSMFTCSSRRVAEIMYKVQTRLCRDSYDQRYSQQKGSCATLHKFLARIESIKSTITFQRSYRAYCPHKIK